MSNKNNICVNCTYSDDAPIERRTNKLYLVCRLAVPATDGTGHAIWPLVKSEDHCGDFQRKSNSDDVVVAKWL